MRVLVANLGSTSFKYRLYAIDGIDGAEARMLARGGFERVTDYGAVIDQAMDGLASAGYKSQLKGQAEGVRGSIVDFLKHKPFQTQNYMTNTTHCARRPTASAIPFIPS